MRLAYLVSKYPSENHTYIFREVAGLRARGFEIGVVAITGDDRDRAEVTVAELAERDATFVVKSRGVTGAAVDNIAVALCNPRGYIRGLWAACRMAGGDLRRLMYNAAYFAEAVVVGRWARRHDYSHVHVHYASTVGLLVAHVFGIGVSATIHGSAEFINPDLQQIRAKVRGLDFVVAISKYGRSQLMLNSDPEDWEKILVVPLGVDCSAPAASAQVPHHDGQVPERPFHVSCVGQLQPAKGIHILLDAVGLLATRGYRVCVTLVGDGPYAASLAARAAALDVDVIFAGRLNHDRVRAVYDRSDAFVLASFAEGVPVVLMEAMRYALPCVATRITGIPELIRDGIDGLLVTPSDVSELADAITVLITDPEFARQIAASGRDRVAERYNLDVNLDALASVFRSYCERRRSVVKCGGAARGMAVE